MSAAVTAGTAAALANPLVAEAAMTPSLKNTLLSVVAGGIVLAAIARRRRRRCVHLRQGLPQVNARTFHSSETDSLHLLGKSALADKTT